MKRFALFMILLAALVFAAPGWAAETLTYISQPEEVTIFLNNIAFVRDTITLSGNADVKILLPDQIFPDTLILRENGARVADYRMNRAGGPLILSLVPTTTSERNITLEYLVSGISWSPSYDMALGEENVDFAFFAQITNSAFTLDNVKTVLAAGKVDVSQQVNFAAAPTVNQYIAGYDDRFAAAPSGSQSVTIQHQYPVANLSAVPGDTVYRLLMEETLPARRILLWNAKNDSQVNIIYKVKNTSATVLAEGIVRAYQNGLFVGSDFIEFTPLGSEGSVTVGRVQDMRVNRAESTSYIQSVLSDIDTLHEITLTVSNFGPAEVVLDIVDYWNAGGIDFKFSQEPQREAGNLLRWTVAVVPGETLTITYSYKAPY